MLPKSRYSDSLIKHAIVCVTIVLVSVVAGVSYCVKQVLSKLM